MEIQEALGKAFAKARRSAKLTQEDFEPISPRTYISHLERGLSAPTIVKLDQLANVMGIHAVTLLFQAYLQLDKHPDPLQLMATIIEDSKKINTFENDFEI